MKRGISYLAMILLAVFLMAPFVWMVLVSLHPSKSQIPEVANLIPSQPAWENYRIVLFESEIPVARFFFNSVFTSVTVVIGQLLVSSMAAFGFARHRFRFKEAIFTCFLLSMMFSGIVTQIPVFLMMRFAGLLDTYSALIVPGLSSAFSIFLLRQFFQQIPFELDEAARLDGAREWDVYWRVVMPLSRPALVTVSVFTFVAVWSEFFWPLIATSSLDMRTLEVGLSIFKNSYGTTNWPLQMTAAVIVVAPILAVFLAAQRYFVRGITLGSLK